MSIISCKSLTLGYDSHVVASGVDFSLNVGDYLCIVGENGSGKTTLMRTLLGFIKPISGSIEMPRDGIGYLPQQTGIQRDFPAGVCEVVRSGMVGKSGFFGFLTKEQKEKADAVMERVGIASLAGKSYRELSGGQQQRVLLARALCASSGILLLDEPASALDPESGMNMYAMISGLNKKEKATVIMITHDVDNAIGYASHVLDMGASCRFCTGAEYRKEGK